MTQGIYPFPYQELDFAPDTNKLPPYNIEAESAVLSGILLDPNAIYRIKDRLKPEHFYIDAHKDIYQACLRLCNQDKPTDLMSVTSWLRDKGILTRVGGQNKLASLITPDAINIDAFAAEIIEKSVRRDFIRVLKELSQLGFDTSLEIPEIFSLATNKFRSVVEMPIAPTKDEHQKWKHDRLLSELTKIYTTCAEPSLRLLKLKDLADEHRLSMNFLELFYLKSLVAQCTKLLNYDELKELAGSTVREWLLNGLIPKNTTILLAADGGIGKTKLIYALGKILIQGDKFGHFHSTGDKRKILYYQGDESPGDMLQALESLGYGADDINKYVKVRFGWSAENMPALIQDLTEFKPDFVVIDSLSTANKFSTYQESQMEYARPILEMTGLAAQHNTTFVIIHHTNRDGGVRGTTAIRNAVSEVWTLTKDKSETSTPHDRILEINKSRSRSSGKKYRMIFSPDDLSFTFLGEEYEQGYDAAEQSAKNTLLEFFAANRNIKFTTEEIAHRTQYSKGHLRNCLSGLAADGLISVERRPGQANLYFLAMNEGDREGDRGSDPTITPNSLRMTAVTIPLNESQPIIEDGIKFQSDHPRSPHDHPTITPHDHPQNVITTVDTDEGDRAKYTFISEDDQGGDRENRRSPDHLRPEASPSNDLGVIVGGDRQVIDDHPTITPDQPKGESPTTPKIEEGRIYWSKSLGKQVRVNKIYPSVKKADVSVAGDPFEKPRLAFSDLFLSPPQLAPGDKVEVLAGKHKGETLLISSVHEGQYWLKKDAKGFNKPVGPFTPDQLRRV
jgi:replicative DNA helicase